MERSIRVLHICNDFCGSKVHSNLYQKLDKEGVEQTIFTYLKNRSICGRNQFAAMHTTFIYKDIFSSSRHLKGIIVGVFRGITEKSFVDRYPLVGFVREGFRYETFRIVHDIVRRF